jgi:hypothetical protein
MKWPNAHGPPCSQPAEAALTAKNSARGAEHRRQSGAPIADQSGDRKVGQRSQSRALALTSRALASNQSSALEKDQRLRSSSCSRTRASIAARNSADRSETAFTIQSTDPGREHRSRTGPPLAKWSNAHNPEHWPRSRALVLTVTSALEIATLMVQEVLAVWLPHWSRPGADCPGTILAIQSTGHDREH